MAEKSITVSTNGLEDAFNILERLQLTAGYDATVAYDGTLHVKAESLDPLVEEYMQAMSKAEPDDPVDRPDPSRRDVTVHIPDWARLELMEHQAKFIDDYANAQTKDQQLGAVQAWKDYRNKLRIDLITPIAQGHVIHGHTCCYGGTLEGAQTLTEITGEQIRCDRLIHLTHPVSPEDLLMRESRVWCSSIVRYRVPGLDDAAWVAQNEPLQDINPETYRELLFWRKMA